MPTVTKSPTSTYVIVPDWINPTYAYTSDNLRTGSATFGSQQGYGDYGFTFPAGTSIDKVEIGCEGYVDITGQYIEVYYSVNGGSTWTKAGTQSAGTETLTYWNRTGDRAWTPDHLSDENFKTKIYAYVPAPCLHPDTPIVMWDGTRKPIRTIEVGDEVKSWSPEKGVCKGIVKAVTMHKGVFRLRKIWYRCPEHNEDEYVSVTPNHRIYSGEKLVEVGRLKPGDMLNHYVKSLNVIVPIPILKIGRDTCREVWNIQTQPENYFIGHRTILIHNEIKW